jgi:hypothetical protein
MASAVETLLYSKMAWRATIRVSKAAVSIRSRFREMKKFSRMLLSQHLPLRLMLPYALMRGDSA